MREETSVVGASSGRTVRAPRLQRYGPWAVVTGASDGIGRAFAEELAAAGLDLVLVARRAGLLEELAERLSRSHGVECRVVAADLGTASGVALVVAETKDLDVGFLVAAAGFGTSGALVGGSLESELAMIDVNCRAVVSLSHAFGARFVERRRGGLVLLSSIVAFQGVPLAANYAATKAFVQTFAEGLRAELRPFGVDVLSAAPGPVESGFARRAGMVMGSAASPTAVARGTLAALPRAGTVRPGFLAKFLGGSLALLPRGLRVRVMAVIMRGMVPRGV